MFPEGHGSANQQYSFYFSDVIPKCRGFLDQVEISPINEGRELLIFHAHNLLYTFAVGCKV